MILSKDVTAIENKEKIYRALGLPASDLEDLKTRLRIEGFSSYSFFYSMLNSYKSRNGVNATLKNLIDHLTRLHLNNVAGKILQFFVVYSNRSISHTSTLRKE